MTKKGLLSSVPPAGPGLEVLVELFTQTEQEQAGPVKQASRKKQLGKKIRSSPAAFLEWMNFFWMEKRLLQYVLPLVLSHFSLHSRMWPREQATAQRAKALSR